MIFYFHANKTHFHNKVFALSLVLKVHFWKSKWPITDNPVVCILPTKRIINTLKESGKARMIHIIFFLIWDQLFESPGNRKASLRKRRLMFVTQILLYEGASQHATKNRIDQETWAIWGDALKWYTEYVVLYIVTSHDLPWKNTDYGCLPFTWEIQKFWLENQMAPAIPFGELQKIWAVIWGDSIFFYSFSLFSWFWYWHCDGQFFPPRQISQFYVYAQDFHPGYLCKW